MKWLGNLRRSSWCGWREISYPTAASTCSNISVGNLAELGRTVDLGLSSAVSPPLNSSIVLPGSVSDFGLRCEVRRRAFHFESALIVLSMIAGCGSDILISSLLDSIPTCQ